MEISITNITNFLSKKFTTNAPASAQESSSTSDSNKTLYNASITRENTSNSSTPSLNQGKKFKKYQNQTMINLEENPSNIVTNFKEGFIMNKINKENFDVYGNYVYGNDNDNDSYHKNSLVSQSNRIINNNNYSSLENSLDNLKNTYKNTLHNYQAKISDLSKSVTGYIDRVDPNNPYLNNTVKFTTGQLAYVTNQGVVKYIANNDILTSVNIPQTPIQINIEWNNSWDSVGTLIPTTPPLVLGTPMKKGQSIGNEGTNIFVNQLIDNPEPLYMGCYSDNDDANKTMTFIGGSPPVTNVSLKNGSFSQPQITSNSYQYINSSSTVPGWTFNAVLVNQSSAWGFPTPYPCGNQCACIQMTQTFSQTLQLNSGVTYYLSFISCGRNCCDDSGLSNPIDIILNDTDNSQSNNTKVFSFTTPVNKWIEYSTTFSVSKTKLYELCFNGTWSSSDRSTAVQNIELGIKSSNSESGGYTYDQCEKSAIDGGWRYFALQNVNTTSSKGFCAVSNSEPAIKRLGIGYTPNGMNSIWSSNTDGQPGNIATLTNTGALSVVNPSGASIFSTPNDNAQPSNYLGCYGDAPTRAMTLLNGGSQQYNLQQCQTEAKKNGSQYFGLQNSMSGNDAQCGLSSDLSQTVQYGKAGNCTKISDGTWSGGGWSNAVYSATTPSSNYFLILQDDGNMCIYRGTGPNDNQGLIWSSNTSGKQGNPNSSMKATNGKYGKNWIPSGSTLAIGEFVGSNNGDLALVMTTTGNLVLYTYKNVVNCQKMNDGNMGGGPGANAAYDIGKTGMPSNMTKLAYVDADSNLHEYPSSNTEFSREYTKTAMTQNNSMDSGNMISADTFEKCQTYCNGDKNCDSFVFNGQHKSCRLNKKTVSHLEGFDTYSYSRNKQPLKPPLGVPLTTENIDSVKYNNYINGGKFKNEYGLAGATRLGKEKIDEIQRQINMLSEKVSSFTDKFHSGSISAKEQSSKNIIGLQGYLKEFYDTEQKLSKFNANPELILKDSDIIVLQKNYEYLFWTIFATATVLLTMNVLRS